MWKGGSDTLAALKITDRPIYNVSVRDLVEFALRTGDLGGNRDFVARDRARAGTRGHQQVQQSRPEGYRKEVRLSHDVATTSLILRVQGRIDGLLQTPAGVLLEEIKTVQAGWDGQADPLHWAQAKIYAFIYTLQQSLSAVRLRLTYLQLENGRLSEFEQEASHADLARFFHEAASVYLEWLEAHQRWCQLRDTGLRRLAFPFSAYRAGQRELCVAVYRVIAQGQHLFAEAPTGIGKTISVLFPALKALGDGKAERIFYLTARNTGAAAAEKACADLRASGQNLRTLVLTAREKLCQRDGVVCDLSTCPLARGYFDRRRPAMRAALERQEIHRGVLEEIAQQHQVCPHELSLDVSAWVDVVIGDYNYLFDPKAYLRRHFDEISRPYVFLIDEAHNLPDRAREMFSAEIDAARIDAVRRAMETHVPACGKALRRLGRALRALRAPSGEITDKDSHAVDPELNLFPDRPAAAAAEDRDRRTRPARRDARALADAPPAFKVSELPNEEATRCLREIPPDLLPPLEKALEEAEAWLACNEPASFRTDLLELFFELLAFARATEEPDAHFVAIIQTRGSVRVRWFCLDPSERIAQALERGSAAVFFSATLTPMDYYRELLDGGTEARTLQLSSPFPKENLAVLVHAGLATHYRARQESLAEVVESIGAVIQARRGHYLVYLPSYEYLASVHAHFERVYPTVHLLVQHPSMSDAERRAFLGALQVPTDQTQVGFAVLGGIFAEGIDLVGEHLIGAIVVGVGLPQVCLERDLIRAFFQEKNGAGFAYAYVYPGWNRVLQATGRVIRSETDRGTVLLIDRRLAGPPYRDLLPSWWEPSPVRSTEEIEARLAEFWPKGPVGKGTT